MSVAGLLILLAKMAVDGCERQLAEAGDPAVSHS
jgi:hypothetical protein